MPAGVKKQLADIPVRALREPELLAGIAKLFRDAILAREDALVATTVQQSLMTVRAAMSIYGKQLVERIQRGMKVAFATSIVHMLERALWIVGLAVVIVLFIPEVPLRSRAHAEAPAAAGRFLGLPISSCCCVCASAWRSPSCDSSRLLRHFRPERRASDRADRDRLLATRHFAARAAAAQRAALARS